MSMNTVRMDLVHRHPFVRGLALRVAPLYPSHLFGGMVEVLQAGLVDRHPYVRKTAAIGVHRALALGRLSRDEATRLITDVVRAKEEGTALVFGNLLASSRTLPGQLVDPTVLLHAGQWTQTLLLSTWPTATNAVATMNALDPLLYLPHDALFDEVARTFVSLSNEDASLAKDVRNELQGLPLPLADANVKRHN